METEGPSDLQRLLLLHLLTHRGHQVRFEADQWTTEFGILRAFHAEDPGEVKNAIRALEMARWVYRRMQYVIGYSEPKVVFSLTPSGHRLALELQKDGSAPDACPTAEKEATSHARSATGLSGVLGEGPTGGAP